MGAPAATLPGPVPMGQARAAPGSPVHSAAQNVWHTILSAVLGGRLRLEVFRFQFSGTRRSSAPGGHLVGPGDILPTGT